MSVTTYYLEMKHADKLQAKSLPGDVLLMEVTQNQPSFNKALYQLVGDAWQWKDKLTLSREAWQAYVERESLRTWVAYRNGAIAGYYELEQNDHDVEIKYFGLTKEFIGKGLGRGLLSSAIQNAWQWSGTERIWVHTCTLDHPNALNNYQRCGFDVYKTEVED